MHQLRTVNTIYTELTKVDLFNQGPLHAFARLAVSFLALAAGSAARRHDRRFSAPAHLGATRLLERFLGP